MHATITEKQAAILKQKGIPYDPTVSRNEARNLVKLAMNSASRRTRSRLDAFGIEYDPYIPQDEAHALLDQHVSQTRALYNDLNAQPDLLFDLASQVVNWSHETPARAKGPCPMCGHSDFYVTRNHNAGGCFGCQWETKGQGAGPVGFWAQLRGLEWHEATRQLSNAQPAKEPVTVHVPPRATAQPENPANGEKWRNIWASIINSGYRRLSAPTNTGRAYLESRGIDYTTMQAFNVSTTAKGYGKYQDVECCLFPYYDTDGTLCAVNKRLTVKPDKKSDKARMAKGSKPKGGFFGVWGFSGLVWIVEGEINAMSVYQGLQALGRSDTVLSVGSEAFIRSRAGEFADRWDNDCVVWCDSPAVRDVVRNAGLSCWSTRQDANGLLLGGKLADCIRWILGRIEQKA